MSLFTNRRPDDQPTDAATTAADAVDEWERIDDVPASPDVQSAAVEVPPAPRRRLDDEHRAHAGNIEIDVAGLLEMLEIDDPDDYPAISAAWQRFLAEHQPLDGDDDDTAALKDRIRREINTAYASFRLTRAS